MQWVPLSFYAPPVLIYPRKRMRYSISFGAPLDTVCCCQDKTELFCKWICRFIAAVNPTPEAYNPRMSSRVVVATINWGCIVTLGSWKQWPVKYKLKLHCYVGLVETVTSEIQVEVALLRWALGNSVQWSTSWSWIVTLGSWKQWPVNHEFRNLKVCCQNFLSWTEKYHDRIPPST
jgi:hypothetical protein